MTHFTYYNPVKIHFGVDIIQKLPAFIKSRNALVITSKGFKRRGTVDYIQSLSNRIVAIIDNVKPNPTLADVEEIYVSTNQIQFDLIIALGGGSVIDVAKAISVRPKSGSVNDLINIIKDNDCKLPYKITPIIAIPTTAGTGSEVTPWATIWDTKEMKKYSLHLKDLWCEACVCDPILTQSLPKDITIQTGLDALSHAVEAVINVNANPISNSYAIEATQEIITILPELVADLDSIQLRSQMMLASLKAGLAFSNTQTSIAHAISYYLTLHKSLPHGIACSITLPDIIDLAIGVNDELDKELFKMFGALSSVPMRKLFTKLQVSIDLRSYNILKDDLLSIRESLSHTSRAKNSILDVEGLFLKLESNV
ncbi:phosphonoacetaldehyde reductase [Desulfuribacillus alkaliarsenatis]|uniref:Uncharacterized protein n=1 Tax=Desulfuribacillus alkaliarsenatis TaxID=766136 RepID=A0A1E5G3T7_9FIRM|nr:phosphonoacetaldehyde reductase [Desulfuribacillus alkaliarsenatis]OEF97726.1 hypothetical protein BHF68_14100 [Desulfuribacillus alkaliarsenatis]